VTVPLSKSGGRYQFGTSVSPCPNSRRDRRADASYWGQRRKRKSRCCRWDGVRFGVNTKTSAANGPTTC